MQNRRYSTSGQADDEYDFDGPPRKRSQKKGASNDQKATHSSILAKRILTQQERCFYCFENPNRPRHLVVSIANFTYLMLPMQQPVVPGHCCIVTMQVCFLLRFDHSFYILVRSGGAFYCYKSLYTWKCWCSLWTTIHLSTRRPR